MKRVDANLIPFAKNNPSGYRFAFGTDTATDDINVNYNDNIKKGWGTTPNEFPEVEDFNAMAYTSSYLTAYLYQMGISEWNNKQNYRANSRVIASDGNLYKSLTGTSETPNTGNNPLSDVVNWGIDNQFYINSLASKANPIDTDNFGIQETGGLFKKLSWANIKTVLGSLYVGLTGNQTVSGVKTFNSSPWVPNLAVTDYSNNAASTAFVADKILAFFAAPNVSLASNGYQKLPSGLIIQWGTSTNTSYQTYQTFPLVFPNAIYSLTVSPVSYNLAVAANNYIIATGNLITSSFYWNGIDHTGSFQSTAGSLQIKYIAIGY